MDDAAIVRLYWDRNEQAIPATAEKYGSYCTAIARNILGSPEDAEECGIRELKEETGCTAGRIVPLGAIYPSPGFLTEVTYLFAALDLTEGEMQPDEDEFVEVVRLPIAEVEKMIERDEIRDAKTVAAMYRAKLKNLY